MESSPGSTPYPPPAFLFNQMASSNQFFFLPTGYESKCFLKRLSQNQVFTGQNIHVVNTHSVPGTFVLIFLLHQLKQSPAREAFLAPCYRKLRTGKVRNLRRPHRW